MKYMSKIEGKFSLEIKRFYLPVIIKRRCPECGSMVENDLEQVDYLNYPWVNTVDTMYFYCGECGCGFEKEFILTIGLEVDE